MNINHGQKRNGLWTNVTVDKVHEAAAPGPGVTQSVGLGEEQSMDFLK